VKESNWIQIQTKLLSLVVFLRMFRKKHELFDEEPEGVKYNLDELGSKQFEESEDINFDFEIWSGVSELIKNGTYFKKDSTVQIAPSPPRCIVEELHTEISEKKSPTPEPARMVGPRVTNDQSEKLCTDTSEEKRNNWQNWRQTGHKNKGKGGKGRQHNLI